MEPVLYSPSYDKLGFQKNTSLANLNVEEVAQVLEIFLLYGFLKSYILRWLCTYFNFQLLDLQYFIICMKNIPINNTC